MFKKRERTWGHLDQQLQACLLLGNYQGRLNLYLQFEPCIPINNHSSVFVTRQNYKYKLQESYHQTLSEHETQFGDYFGSIAPCLPNHAFWWLWKSDWNRDSMRVISEVEITEGLFWFLLTWVGVQTDCQNIAAQWPRVWKEWLHTQKRNYLPHKSDTVREPNQMSLLIKAKSHT